ncbi:MAG: NAD-dependent epimerase/dehydratase family protein [Anaerolineae bacterium]
MDLAEKTVLITGANGFIGSHLVERLANQKGARVRGLVRQSFPVPHLTHVEYCTGDVTDPAAVQRAAQGCDVIIHTAALQPFRPLPSRARFDAVNVGGTRNLLDAFSPGGPGRFLLLSTINVHGLPPPAGANAESPLIYSGDRYSDTKADGERAAWTLAHDRDIPLTVIRPACTFGPGSTAWTLQPIERLRRGRPVLIGDGRGLCNPVYIDNLVDLVIAALENDTAVGQAFIGSDGVGIEWREFFQYYARMVKRPVRSIPSPVARLAGVGSALIEKITGQPGPLARPSVAFYTHHVRFDTSKNMRLLGYTPRVSFQEGMRRTEEWLREKQII